MFLLNVKQQYLIIDYTQRFWQADSHIVSIRDLPFLLPSLTRQTATHNIYDCFELFAFALANRIISNKIGLL